MTSAGDDKARRGFWRTPSLRTDEEDAKHRPVTWLELFLDVFFVVAVAGLAHDLGDDVSAAGVGAFVAQFLPLNRKVLALKTPFRVVSRIPALARSRSS